MARFLSPRVSVIVPFYGVERYLAQTIRSVLAQTYSAFELLLIDDGSLDRSVAICQQFHDPRIRLLRQTNQGPAAARNLGISHARGEYLAFLDGDDLWAPEKLAKHVEHLDRNPRVGVSFSRSKLIDEDDRPLQLHQMSKLRGIDLLDLLCRTPIGNGSVPVIRRQVFEQIRFQPRDSKQACYFVPSRALHPSEDVECWVRIALSTSWQFEGLAEPLTLYRINSQGCSANLLNKLQSWQVLLDMAQDYAPGQIRACRAPAMAYQLRHLARRAVSLRDGEMAVNLGHRAVRQYPQILLEEPGRSLQTLLAAYCLAVLPRWFYEGIEQQARRSAGWLQRRRLTAVPPPQALRRRTKLPQALAHGNVHAVASASLKR